MEPKKQAKQPSKKLHKIYRRPLIILVAFALILFGIATTAFLLRPQGERVNTNGYQVVYMTSGQAYFGKLKNITGEYLILQTPYTAQEVKPAGEEAENVQTSTTLVKISQQQYGPTDVMSLKSDQVLFWQNLRDDSKVSQAIKSAN